MPLWPSRGVCSPSTHPRRPAPPHSVPAGQQRARAPPPRSGVCVPKALVGRAPHPPSANGLGWGVDFSRPPEFQVGARGGQLEISAARDPTAPPQRGPGRHATGGARPSCATELRRPAGAPPPTPHAHDPPPPPPPSRVRRGTCAIDAGRSQLRPPTEPSPHCFRTGAPPPFSPDINSQPLPRHRWRGAHASSPPPPRSCVSLTLVALHRTTVTTGLS